MLFVMRYYLNNVEQIIYVVMGIPSLIDSFDLLFLIHLHNDYLYTCIHAPFVNGKVVSYLGRICFIAVLLQFYQSTPCI